MQWGRKWAGFWVAGIRAGQKNRRRNQMSVQSVKEPMLPGSRPLYAVECTNYTDLRLLRGETFQTIPFENVQKVEFLPDGEVIVGVRSGIQAKMKVRRRAKEILEGFKGASSRGDFYVPLKFVRSVAFVVDAD